MVNGYGCNNYTYAAPEYAYTYIADSTGPVTITLGEEEAETDVIVLEDKGLGCNPASCVDWGMEDVTFDAVEGTVYYIVVDGFLDATGAYELTFSCGS